MKSITEIKSILQKELPLLKEKYHVSEIGIKKVPVSLRKKYTSIPWKELAGMRDKLIYNYSGVNLNIVWETVKQELPPLLKDFEKILEDLEKEILKK